MSENNNYGSSFDRHINRRWGVATKNPRWSSIGHGVLEMKDANGATHRIQQVNGKWTSVSNQQLQEQARQHNVVNA